MKTLPSSPFCWATARIVTRAEEVQHNLKGSYLLPSSPAPWPCFCPLGPSQDIGSFLCHGSTMSAAISEPPAPADPAPWDALPNGVLLVPPEDLCSRSLLCCYQFPERPTKQSSPLIRLLPFHCFVFSLWYFDIFLLLSFIGVRLSLSLGSTFQWSQGFCSRPHP